MTHKGDTPKRQPGNYQLAKIAAGFKAHIEPQDLDDLPPKMKALLDQIQERDKS
jgi:hypothetical protein